MQQLHKTFVPSHPDTLTQQMHQKTKFGANITNTRQCPQPEPRHTRNLPSDDMARQRTCDVCPTCFVSPFFPPGILWTFFPVSTLPETENHRSDFEIPKVKRVENVDHIPLSNKTTFSLANVCGNHAVKVPQWFLIDIISRDHVESESEGCQAGTLGRFFRNRSASNMLYVG